jgi:hypothetical protein
MKLINSWLKLENVIIGEKILSMYDHVHVNGYEAGHMGLTALFSNNI